MCRRNSNSLRNTSRSRRAFMWRKGRYSTASELLEVAFVLLSARYKVLRMIPSTSPTYATVMSRCSYSLLAVRSLSREMETGLPPARPRARATAMPALVRSCMRSRSNSARDTKILNTSRTSEEEVSTFSCRDLNSTPRCCSAPM